MTFFFDGWRFSHTDLFTKPAHSGGLFSNNDSGFGAYGAALLDFHFTDEGFGALMGFGMDYRLRVYDFSSNTYSYACVGRVDTSSESFSFSPPSGGGAITGSATGLMGCSYAGFYFNPTIAQGPIGFQYEIYGQFDPPGSYRWLSPMTTIAYIPDMPPGEPCAPWHCEPTEEIHDDDRWLIAQLIGDSSIEATLSTDLLPGLSRYFDDTVDWRRTDFDFP